MWTDHGDPDFDGQLLGGLPLGYELRGRLHDPSFEVAGQWYAGDLEAWETLDVAPHPDDCDHIDTICANCADSWSNDWDLRIFAVPPTSEN